MKKTAFMIVYNDVDYVEYAINSIKDWVDEFIVVEGAFEITMETGRPVSPRSDDGTLEILLKYVASGDIILRHANLREHKDHYDIGYQHAIENGSDWAIMIDSDEVWVKKSMMLADTFMERCVNTDAMEMRVQEYCFINDFKTWYPGTYPRIFKATPGSKFVFDNEVQFDGMARGDHPVHLLPGRDIHHYGYVREKKRWQLKQDYMYNKDQNPILKSYGLEENTYTLPSDIPIYQYTGEHPALMKDHPFHNLSAEQIIYG